jgi:hypothetical protein
MAKDRKLSPRAIAAKGALAVYLRPRLATDAQPALATDLNGILKGVTAKKFAAQKAGIAGNVKQVFGPKMASDGDLDLGEVAALLDALNGAMNGGGEGEFEDEGEFDDVNEDDPLAPPIEGGEGGEGGGDAPGGNPSVEIMNLLSEQGLAPELLQQIAALCDKMGKPAPKPALKPPTQKPEKKEGQMPEGIQKPAMDAAIAEARTQARAEAIKEMNAIHLAQREVEPLIGAVTGDSAASVYKMALDAAKITVPEGLQADALRVMVSLLPRQSETPAPIANDAAANAETIKRFPALATFGRAI